MNILSTRLYNLINEITPCFSIKFEIRSIPCSNILHTSDFNNKEGRHISTVEDTYLADILMLGPMEHCWLGLPEFLFASHSNFLLKGKMSTNFKKKTTRSESHHQIEYVVK